MTHWNRVRSALEWSTFFGACTWLLASGITNTMNAGNVWFLILSRVLMGLVIGVWKTKIPWWLRGLLVGFVINIPAGLVVNGWTDFGNNLGLIYMMATGLIIGVMTEVALRHREKELAEANNSK